MIRTENGKVLRDSDLKDASSPTVDRFKLEL
jgi:hypothetical protein